MNPDFIAASVGGLLIGISSIVLLAMLGRVSGISGIFLQSLLNFKTALSSENAWRWLFLTGLIVGPIIAHQLLGYSKPDASEAGPLMAAIAGVIVGVGTKIGGGCTSGHGICGIGRLSARSIIATLCFMAAGIITVYLSHYFV